MAAVPIFSGRGFLLGAFEWGEDLTLFFRDVVDVMEGCGLSELGFSAGEGD